MITAWIGTGWRVILSLIDRPWAAQELITAFREIWEERHESKRDGAPLVLALLESVDPATRSAGEECRVMIGDDKYLEQESAWFKRQMA